MNKKALVLVVTLLAALLVGIAVVTNLNDDLHGGTGGGVGARAP